MAIGFIADHFLEDFAGGAEHSDEALILRLLAHGDVHRCRSRAVTVEWLEQHRQGPILVANALQLQPGHRRWLEQSGTPYFILEHDHHYLRGRNPCLFPDWRPPAEELCHLSFYGAARWVVCQSSLHEQILRRCTRLENTWSQGTNFWRPDWLAVIRRLRQQGMRWPERTAVMQSQTPVKNTQGALELCRQRGWSVDALPSMGYPEFLQTLGCYGRLVFLPGWVESFSRLVAEAGMLGLEIVSNRWVGLLEEPWLQPLLRDDRRLAPELIDCIAERNTWAVQQLLTRLTSEGQR